MTRQSIRSRLIGRLVFALLALAVAANAALYAYLRGELIEEYDDALQTQAWAAAAVWQASGTDRDQAAMIARAFPDLHFGREDGDFLRVVGVDGSTVLRLPAADDTVWRDPSRAPSRRGVIYDLTLPGGRTGRAIEIGIDAASPTTAGPRPAPQFALVLAQGRREMDQTLGSLAVSLFAIGGGLTAATIAIVLVIVRNGLTPLSNFSEAVGRLDVRTLGYRFRPDESPDELRPMAERLNDLLHRLDAAFERERRFSGNVAHELRTPLAELRAMVEVAMKWPPDPDELRRHHAGVLEVVQRMSAVTQTLLALVRSNSMRMVAPMTELDLVGRVRAAAATHEAAAAMRNVGLDFDLPPRQSVAAEPALLASPLDNLLGNAAQYSPAGGRITCAIGRDASDGRIVLTLGNPVDNLTDDDLLRLDEPFWRKDAARSPGDHVGLGLALARSYADAMDVGLDFRMPTAKRLEVSLRFKPSGPPVII